MNQLILGDCHEVMKRMDSESVDLIYLDPPFFSNRNYEVIWGDKGEVLSFEDRWSGGIMHYIEWLKIRVDEMYRLLKSNGSIYLHCDYHANAYIKVYILDRIFGENNFKNEIIWAYKLGGRPKDGWARKHDNIYYYVKNHKNFVFNADSVKIPYDSTGGYISSGRKIVGNKEYRVDPKGKIPEDWWSIPALNHMEAERIGYPTQKPEKLLERIILASSNEGDVVLDPFVGGGTTVAVADKLGRKWIGIDQSVQAIKVSEYRLNKQQDLYSQPFFVQLHKYDYDTLRYKDAFEFETWIITQFGIKMGMPAYPQNKKGGDHGFDGKLKDGTPIQVKRSDNVGVNVAKNFLSSCHLNEPVLYEKKKGAGEAIGFIIAFSFGKGTIEAVAKMKSELGVNIQLVKVEEIVPIAKKPKLKVTITDLGNNTADETKTMDETKTSKKTQLREIQFTALAESEAGIEMYSWDWDYEEDKPFKAEIILDKSGTQTMKFKPGNHTIAVKAVDNDGLEAIEVIKIKVNGVVERG